jgi:hypothetical protein
MADAAENMTIAEFDKFVDGVADGRKYELFDGAPVLMSNPNETHEQIVGNIGAPLKLATGCAAVNGSPPPTASRCRFTSTEESGQWWRWSGLYPPSRSPRDYAASSGLPATVQPASPRNARRSRT